MPQIAVINESTAISDADVQKMIPAFDQQWNKDLRPIWGVDAATFNFIPKGRMPPAGSWWCVFLDNSDQADALAYHDLTNEGLPISKVFAKTLMQDKASISVGATHELCEMAVDPWLNSAYQDPHGTFWAGEMLWGGRRGWQFRRLHQSMECRDVPAERFEQVPGGAGPR